jgi:hypothetical protein
LRLDRKVDVYETEQYCMKEETLTELGSWILKAAIFSSMCNFLLLDRNIPEMLIIN